MLGLRRRFHLAVTATAALLVSLAALVSAWVATAATSESVRFNDRPPALLLPFAAVALALVAATSLAGSTPLDVAAGVLAGGSLANIASPFLWHEGIPDFIPAHGVLLNGADLAMAVGIGGLVTVALLLAGREAAARAAR
jgi:lipoprotein signal peptidase